MLLKNQIFWELKQPTLRKTCLIPLQNQAAIVHSSSRATCVVLPEHEGTISLRNMSPVA